MGTLNHEKTVFSSIVTAFALLTVAFWVTPTIATPKDGVYQMVLHDDDNDPKRMNMALNNAASVDKFYKTKGEEVTIEKLLLMARE